MKTKTTIADPCGLEVRWANDINRESTPTVGLPVLDQIRKRTLYRAEENEDVYSHHSYIAQHRGTLYATWSNHARDEDASGQRVRFTRSMDGGITWQPVSELFPPHDHIRARAEQDNLRDRVLIANGFAVVDDTLYAIAEAHLLGEKIFMASPTGIPQATDVVSREFWSRPGLGRLARAVTPEKNGPIFWLVDNPPDPVPGFPAYSGVADPEFAETAAAINAFLATPEHWPSWEFLHHTCHVWAADGHRLCEPTPAWRLPDGTLARIWRDVSRGSHSQYAHFSRDGKTWGLPRRMPFPDAYSRSTAGNLPDGTAYVINNPGNGRDPLVISLAADGLTFDRHAVIACNAPPRRFEGQAKDIGFQYPHATVAGDTLHVIYSINKEDIETAAIPLDTLKHI